MCSAFDSMVVMFILYIRNYSPRINEFQSFPHQKFQVHPLSPQLDRQDIKPIIAVTIMCKCEV